MAKEIKLVAESLKEWETGQVNELLGVTKKEKWDKLDKNNEKALRDFAVTIDMVANSQVGRNKIKEEILKMPVDNLKKQLAKAEKDGFKGRFVVGGIYKSPNELKLKSVSSSGHSFGGA